MYRTKLGGRLHYTFPIGGKVQKTNCVANKFEDSVCTELLMQTRNKLNASQKHFEQNLRAKLGDLQDGSTIHFAQAALTQN